MEEYLFECLDQCGLCVSVSVFTGFPFKVQKCWTLNNLLTVVVGVLVDQDRILMATLPLSANAGVEDAHFACFWETVKLSLESL